MKSYLKTMGIAGVCLFLLSAAALAGTKYYVNDTLTIPVRTGQALDRKIIALPAVGHEMEVLNTEKDWSLVRLPDGKEGWVLSRFITDETPKGIQLEILKKKYDALKDKAAALTEENKIIKAENSRLGADLNTSETKLKITDSAFETLKQDSTQFLELQTKYKETTSKLAEQTQKAEKYEKELTSLLWSKNIKWFLSGAVVLILGFIIGFSTKSQRRSSSLR